MTAVSDAPADLGRKVRRGLAWSAVNNVVLRFVSLGVSIALARLLSPADFGVFAVAMTVQVILVTLAELGISADLIRHGDIPRRGPTVTTISLCASGTVTAAMILLAGPTATLLGSAAAAPVVRVMALTVLLSGLSVVPYATMQRRFMQRAQLGIDAGSLGISSVVTIGLALLGVGPMALALGRIAGQLCTTCAQIAVTRIRPRVGWDREIAAQVIRFGLPIAGANLLSWVILNVDNMIVGHRLGAVELGFYVLAFNLSSWPMNAVGLTVRSVALPGFAQLGRRASSTALESAAGLTSALGLPLGVGLMIFAEPLVTLVYGAKWAPAVPVLQALGAFGAVRVVLDMFASYLVARGHSRPVLVLQIVWLAALAPAMLVGVLSDGLRGAAWAHVAVGVIVLLPAYLVVLRSRDVAAGRVLRKLTLPLLAVLPAAGAALLIDRLGLGALAFLLVGGAAFALLYAALVLRWVRTGLRTLRATRTEVDEPTEVPA